MKSEHHQSKNTDQATFDDVALQWWDPDGPMKPLHDINPVRLDFILDCMNSAKIEPTVLDVGCGAGILTESLCEHELKVSGIDISSKLIGVAKKHAALSQLTISYYQGSLNPNHHELADQRFPMLSCLEVLEHLADPFELLDHCDYFLQNHGLLFLSTINQTIAAYIKSILLAERVLKLIPVGTHEFKMLIKPSKILGWARKKNYTLVSMRGIEYNPFSRSARLTDDLSNNYILCLKKSG